MAMPNFRSSFDSDDDDHLVEFIAKYNPLPSGRQGNKLYQKLEANENNKWPWSKYHPWQSWRERYRKNQEYFDYRIRKYQKIQKRKESDQSKVVEEVKRDDKGDTKPEPVRDTVKKEKVVPQQEEQVVVPDSQKGTEDEDDPMYELFGSYVEEEEDQEAQDEGKPALPNEPQPPLPQTNTPPTLASKTPPGNQERVPRKSKLKKLPDEEEDPFETPPPTPRLPLSPKRYNAPPTLVEGPFRNTLKRIRPSEHDSSWIPKRRKKATEDVGESLPAAQQPTRPPNAIASSSKITLSNLKPNVALPRMEPGAQPAATKQVVNGRGNIPPVAQTAAISASPSKQISDKAKETAKAFDIPRRDSGPQPVTFPGGDPFAFKQAANGKAKPLDMHPGAALPTFASKQITDKANETRKALDLPRRESGVQTTAIPNGDPKQIIDKVKGKVREGIVPVAAPRREPGPQTATISNGDPFAFDRVKERGADGDKVKGKGKALDIPSLLPRIDLHRQSLQKRLNPSISVASWRGSVISAHTSSTSDSSRRRSLRQSVSELDFSDDGKRFAFQAAQEMAKKMAEMARDHGFSTEVAMRTYTRTGSMAKTKIILEHLRKTLLAAEQEAYEMPIIANDNADTDAEDIPDGLIPTPLRPAMMHESTPLESKRPSSTKRRNPRPSLTVKPLPPDYDAMDGLSEYSPPNNTRAGEFARLTKRGRAEEAMEREKQRVSIGAVPPTRSPTKVNSTLPRVVDVSPTPLSRLPTSAMVPDQEDEDDIYMRTDDEQPQSSHPNPNDEQPHEADDEAESPSRQVQENEDLSLSPFPSIARKLIKRISGGRENDPALIAAAREHRVHASNVDVDNADEMRAFEVKNNPDLLRLWSMNLVHEMITRSRDFLGVKEETSEVAMNVSE